MAAEKGSSAYDQATDWQKSLDKIKYTANNVANRYMPHVFTTATKTNFHSQNNPISHLLKEAKRQ